MNIENLRKELEQGDTFTYKKLCEVLEEKTKGGNSKPKQLEDWNRYFEFEKVGTKIKILNIRDKELPDVNKMLGRSKYYSDLETLILYALNETKNKNGFTLSVSQTLKFTNMVNQNYFTTIGNEYAFCEAYNVDIDFLYAFRNLSRRKIKDIFERTLNTMKNKALINYNKIMMVCVEELSNTFIINENGEKIQEIRRVFRKPTEEEHSLITKAENKALEFVDCIDKTTCVSKGKWMDYVDKMLEILQEDTDILFFYNAYEIFSHEDIVKKEIKIIEQEKAEVSLNEKMCESVSVSKSKLINNDELRNKLVDILLDDDSTTNVRKLFLKIKKINDLTDYDNFMD